MNSSGLDKIKAWMFPGLITVLAAMLWYDIREIKTDVKALMAQSNIDKTRIDGLEREVFEYHQKPISFPNRSSENNQREPKELLFLRPEDRYTKRHSKPLIASNN